MNIRLKAILFITAAISYILLGIYVVNSITDNVTQEYYSLLGDKALDIAEIAAVKFKISDEEVSELRNLQFMEILTHPANIRLNEIFKTDNFSEDLKYAYVMVKLEDNEVEHYVTEDSSEYFGAPAGTPLKILWLLDVIVNDDQQKMSEEDSSYYDNIKRYSVLRDVDVIPFEDRKSMSVLSEDEYGTAFSGLVPLYTTQGTFVGLFGVDIYFESFSKRVTDIKNMLAIVFILPTILLSIIYSIVYFKRIKQSDMSANTDALTMLFNRRYFDKILPRLVMESYSKNTPLAVIMIDIDCFKNYNDNYGHKMGDDIIVKVSNAITSVLRKKYDIVCRYGGEEIIVLLPNTDFDGALCVAEKMHNEINSLKIPHEHSNVDEHITVSQGVFSKIPLSADRDEINDFILKADEALYQAKRLGRNRYEMYSKENYIKRD